MGKSATMPRASRPTMPKIDDDMRHLCASIGGELSTWPRVISRRMFGMVGFYREGLNKPTIFAALPDKRALSSPRAIAFKLDKPKPAQLSRMKSEARLSTAVFSGRAVKWFEFSLESPADIPGALFWLGEAYTAARHK